MSDKSPFVTSLQKRDLTNQAKARLAVENSDQLTLYSAYAGWKIACKEGLSADRNYCQKNCLKRSSLLEIESVAKELVRTVQSLGFDLDLSALPTAWRSKTLTASFKPHPQCPALTPGLAAVLKAVLTAGFYPKVARTSFVAPVDAAANPAPSVCTARTPQGTFALHPGSVNRGLEVTGWIVYQEKVRYSAEIYLQDSTLISAYPLLLFGGDIDVQHKHQLATVDDWILLKAPAKTFVIFKELRKLIDQLLERKLENPRLASADEPLLRILLELIVSEATQQLQRPK